MAKIYAEPLSATETVRNRMNASSTNGDVRYFESVLTATGTEAATGDSFVIAKIPVGAVVLPEETKIANEASMGGSVLSIVKIGDAAVDDRYTATATTIHSSNAAVQSITPNIAASVIPRWKATKDTQEVIAAFTRTNAMTAGKKILFRVAYKLG